MTSSKYEYWWIVVSPKKTRILESDKEKRAIHYHYAITTMCMFNMNFVAGSSYGTFA